MSFNLMLSSFKIRGYSLFHKNHYLQFFQGFGSGFNSMRQFNQNYRCYSVSMLPGHERNDVENGGKSNLFCFVILRNA